MLSPRELMVLEIRAEDRASAAINRVGGSAQTLMGTLGRGSLNAFAYSQAFDTLGRGMTRAGIAMTAATGAAVKANIDFGHAMALANTQAQLSEKGLGDLSKAALEVSSKFGVAGTEIAESLYDIFSTTEQTSDQAIKSVNALAKAAVTGDVQMREATRGVVDIQNAFGKSAGNVTDVLDRQFAMLRISGGTYGELVNAFGNVIGSAKATDQAIESVSGSIAFLTLRGRSQAEASISVSRALDQITRSAGDIKDVLGVSVYDATGNFRQLNDIITDMRKKMADMTTQERSQAFEKMFGAGSIQANRFFRTAIPQFEQLNKSVKELEGSNVGGELAKQFQIMRTQDPGFVFEKLKTQVTNLGIAFAQELMPDLLNVAKFFGRLADTFNKLDPSTKQMIARIVAFGGVFLLVGGKILTFIGTMLRLRSVFQLAGILNSASKGMGAFGTAAQSAGTKTSVAATAVGKWRTALGALKTGLATVGIAVFVALVSKAVQTVIEADNAADEWFKKIEKGKATFADLGLKVDSLQTKVDEFNTKSIAEQFGSLFTGEFFEAQGAEKQIERLNDRLVEHRNQMFGVIKTTIGSADATRQWISSLSSAEGITDKQRLQVANLVGNLDRMGIELNDSQRFTIQAALAAGRYDDALDMLLGHIRSVTGALKNLASSQERTNDKVEIYNQKQQRAEHLTKGTTDKLRENTKALEEQGRKALEGSSSFERFGSAAQNSDRKVKGVTDRAREFSKGSPYTAKLEADDNASGTINSLQNLLNNLERTYHARVEVIQGGSGGVLGIAGGGVIGMATGGMRRASFIARRPTYLVGEGHYSTFAGKGAEAVIPLHSRGLGILAEAVKRGMEQSLGEAQTGWGQRSPMQVTVNAQTNATADEIAREIDWAARTRGW